MRQGCWMIGDQRSFWYVPLRCFCAASAPADI